MPPVLPADSPIQWSCYSILDRGEVPPPLEDASEAAWRDFDACWEALDRRVRESPRRVAPGAAPRPRRQPTPPIQVQAPAASQIDEVMRVARMNDRVCPSPAAWRRLHWLLGALLQPARPGPAPADPIEWTRGTDLQKRLRLREQLAWAQVQGGLHVAHEFLLALGESDWHHHTPPDWPTLCGWRDG